MYNQLIVERVINARVIEQIFAQRIQIQQTQYEENIEYVLGEANIY
ncbi:unnamed protein product [Paramecium sonneborni]|uniref:Uncharacterized protein n=1 Tax=Paramecium sonneborni TaxID=65129 RepID=A0A8S1K436_9CILI|nr:unnamed protein product [Paramecium sonneborni]